MRVPFSILCISDLHFNNSTLEPIKRLGEDLLSYTNDSAHVANKRWVPDYIVIAGDITNQGNTDYSEPEKHIEGLLNEFHLDRKRVIMVPGNHDKDTSSYDLPIYKQECELFDTYQKNESAEIVKKFRQHFVSKFSGYMTFANKYHSADVQNASGYHCYHNPGLLVSKNASVDDNKVKLLSGVRCFKEDSLCFFLVNTEWLYVPPKALMKETMKSGDLGITNNYYDELKYSLSIKENCKLCVPLINDAFNLIKKEYADCTVVTIMHRDFKDLTWAENNHTDPSQKDPIRQIEAVSDIILTGHEHSVKIEQPTFVKNNVQHFQIGSAGRDSTSKVEPIRTACVINVNPSSERVELLNAVYDGIKNNWSFEECERSFPLRPKYPQDNKGHEQRKMDERITVRAKSIDDTIIKAEIEDYFNIKDSSNIELYPIRYNMDSIKDDLENIYKCHGNDKTIFIVIYHVITNNNKNQKVETRDIERFKDNHIVDVLRNRLIISEISVAVPDLIFSDENIVLY